MNRDKRRSKGFSLPEMMVGMFVFSLIMLMVGLVLRGGQEQTQQSDIRMNLEQSVRDGLYRMGLELRESSPSRVTISQGGAVVDFQIPTSVSNSGAVTWSDRITYRVGGNGTQLVRTDTGTGQTTILANDIASVVFTGTGSSPTSVTLSLTAQKSMINGRVLSVISSSEAKIRNP